MNSMSFRLSERSKRTKTRNPSLEGSCSIIVGGWGCQELLERKTPTYPAVLRGEQPPPREEFFLLSIYHFIILTFTPLSHVVLRGGAGTSHFIANKVNPAKLRSYYMMELGRAYFLNMYNIYSNILEIFYNIIVSS